MKSANARAGMKAFHGGPQFHLRTFYKYLPECHARSMLRRGSIRIGTLFDYRREENFDFARGDSREGTHSYRVHFDYVGNPDVDLRDIERYYLDDLGVSIENSRSTFVSGTRSSQNLYIYCVSGRLSRPLADEFNADACVVIWDMPKLVGLISEKIGDADNCWQLGEIQYVDHDHDPTQLGKVHPSLIKLKRFEQQNEFRVAWQPLHDNISARIVTIGNLENICSLLRRDEFF